MTMESNVEKRGHKIDPLKSMFYNSEYQLKLPRDADCYFNWKSSKCNYITLNTQIKELGFLQTNGFKLKESISKFKQSGNTYAISSLSQTLIFYIMYIRYRDYYHSISEILQTLSENQLIDLFLDELQVVYNPKEHDINCFFWTDTMVWDEALAKVSIQSDNEKFISVVCSNEMVRNTIVVTN